MTQQMIYQGKYFSTVKFITYVQRKKRVKRLKNELLLFIKKTILVYRKEL